MKKTYIDTAMERIAPDLILKGGNVVDVFSGRVINADVIIKDGIICGVGSYSGAKTNKTFPANILCRVLSIRTFILNHL